MRASLNATKKQRGFTILEILVAVVIIILFASIVGPLLSDAKDKSVTVTGEITMMRATLENIDARHINESITATLNNAAVIQGRMLATAYRKKGTTNIYNLFGGQITISGIAENGLTWDSTGISSAACPMMVSDAKDLGFETVKIGGGAATKYSTITNTIITAACVAATSSSDEVTITWTRKAY
jgi:prepilin-type N-terminal cleavage/methylation domain-containing protein